MGEIDTGTIKATVRLADYAGRSVRLKKWSVGEVAGPCPVCGTGEDRFHVHNNLFMCRVCHPEWGDVIEYVMWKDRMSFIEAATLLAGEANVTIETKGPVLESSTPAPKRTQPTWDVIDVEYRLSLYQDALAGSAGEEYLIDRGFTQQTMTAYALGYRSDWNAIAMPWFRGGRLWAINYRRVGNVEKKKRFVNEPGGLLSNVLFGAQALLPNLTEMLPNGTDPLARRVLMLVEGEFNCMSIWQVGWPAIDVLSFGAQGSTLPDSAVLFAQRYSACLVWKDQKEIAIKEAQRIKGASALWSDNGAGAEVDANNHLTNGTLRKALEIYVNKATKGRFMWD